MRSVWTTLIPVLLLTGIPSLANASPVSVDAVWARATAGGGTTGAIYATIHATQPDRLIGATTPLASQAEVHQEIMQNGVMEMRPVVGGLPIEPGTATRLEPGGYHIMLMGLAHPLQKGEHFQATLIFAHAGSMTVDGVVAGPGAKAPQ